MGTAIDLDLYAARIARAREKMEQDGLDYLFVGPGSDLFYLTGYNAHLSERMNLLIIGRDGSAAMVVPVLEAPLYAGRESLAPTKTWTETESPSALAASIVGDAAGKKIGVADQLWSVFLIRLQDAVKGASWVSGNDVMRTLRMRKDAKEVETLAEVGRRTITPVNALSSAAMRSSSTGEVKSTATIATSPAPFSSASPPRNSARSTISSNAPIRRPLRQSSRASLARISTKPLAI